MSVAIESKRAGRVAILLLSALGMVTQGAQAEDLVIPLELPQPNFVGVGIGGYPDYFGSDEQALGAAPIARISLGGNRFARLVVNDLRVNLLDHPNWQLGPAAVYRFGRKDVDDRVVRKVHEIDKSLSLGAFGGYIWKDPGEIRRQAGVGGWALGDASGAYDGWTAGLNAFAMQPVARMVSLAGGAAFSYGSENYMDEYFGVTAADSLASGLPIYTPGGGVRDVRGWLVAVVHLGPQWHVGAGVMYSRLVGDAADSPLVSDRGSASQWVYGVGGLYAW
jgi:outer membrane protein